MAGYAAGKASGNSLIKKQSLSGDRLKADTVTGSQIDEGSLGSVPNAAKAANATNATNATNAATAANAANAAHAATADQVPTPTRTSFSYGPGWATDTSFTARAAGYRKDAGGLVHLQGQVTRASGTGTVIATLPVGFRATDYTYFPVYTAGNTFGSVYIRGNGEIVLFGGDASFVSLEGITFYPDN